MSGNMEFKQAIQADYNPFWHTQDIPIDIQTLLDYGSRTDSQPVYVGFAKRGVKTSENKWMIYKMEYDASDRMTSKKTAYGAYDDRASLTYE